MIKKVMFLVLFLGMASTVFGEVLAKVYPSDGNTPPEPQEIMVGTELSIIVDSNVVEKWWGCLIIEDDHRDYGVLSPRGPYLSGDWSGSHLEAAGENALVNDREEPGIDGFSLYTDWNLNNIEAGDWFVIDYNATNIGDCNVGFYKYVPPFDDELIYYLEFTNVRTRDFVNDTIVNFVDFAVLASYWRESGCNAPNWCGGADLNTEGVVDVNDLMLFCSYWLEKTDKRWWPE